MPTPAASGIRATRARASGPKPTWISTSRSIFTASRRRYRQDEYALGKEFPRIAEMRLDSSDDGKYVMARMA